MKTSTNLRTILKSESARQAVLLTSAAIAIGLIFWQLQFSTDAICCGDFDGYYHIKWSRMLWDSLRHGNFPPQFTWLPLTTLDPGHFVEDRKSTRLNSSHLVISYAVFCLKKKKKINSMFIKKKYIQHIIKLTLSKQYS